MGSKSSKPAREQIEIAKVGSNFQPERDHRHHDKITSVIYEHKSLDFRKHTFFSKIPFQFKSHRDKLGICIDGGAVIRIGLVNTCPTDNDDFVVDTQFQIEDGFGHGKEERSLYVNGIGYVCYGKPGHEEEYKRIDTDGDHWLYIISLYGNPTIKASYGSKQMAWSAFQNTAIGLQNSDEEAICGLERNSEVCLLSDPIDASNVYHIAWNMRLEEEAVCEKVPEYGFFRMGIATKKPADLSTFSFHSAHPDVTWFTQSAIRSYPYSGVIAFTIDKRKRELTHNLLVTSVENTHTDVLDIDITQTQRHYLVMEVSSGELSVSHANHFKVRQDHGSIYLVKDYHDTFDDLHELQLQIQNKSDFHQLCRIQFGSNPTSFIVEFNEKFTASDETAMRKTNTNIIRVSETSSVQIMDVPEDVDDDRLEDIFSREQIGGGKIARIKQDADIPGTWVISFSDIKNARNIWMKFECQASGYTFRVLPYFDEIGCAVNYGDIPIVDKEPLVISKLNNDKLNFITKRKPEQKKFVDTMKKTAMVQALWVTKSEDEFEHSDSEEDDDNTYITFDCKVPDSEYKKLAVWKSHTTKCVNDYFSNVIVEKSVQVEDVQSWDEACSLLSSLQRKKDYDFYTHKETLTVKLISSNNETVNAVAREIGKVIAPEETATKKLSVSLTPKYQALNSEKRLRKVEYDNPNTSFMVDNTRQEVTIKGPKNEVERAEHDILTLAADMELISVGVSTEEATILRKELGRTTLEKELNTIKLDTHFKIKGNSCFLWVYIDDNKAVERKTQLVKNAIHSLFKTTAIEIPNDVTKDVLESDIWASFKEETEQDSNGLIVVNKDSTSVTLTGTKLSLEKTKNDLAHFFKVNSSGKDVIQMPRDITRFIIVHADEAFTGKYEFQQDEHKDCTGEVIIKGDLRERQTLKMELMQEASSVKTFWFHMEKQWLASVIMDLTVIEQLASTQKCLLQTEIADSFAERGIPIVAVLPRNGTVIEVIHDDIVMQRVDVVVSPANGDMTHNSGLARAIVDAGGREIQTECTKIVSEKGQVAVGEAVSSGPGRLCCRAIFHAVGPKWRGGNDNEEKTLKTLIQKLLQMMDDNKHTSVVMPALCCEDTNYPIDKASTHIVEAVAGYLVKNSKSTIKEVYLCDSKLTIVDYFTDAMTKVLTGPTWFIFKHGRKLLTTNAMVQTETSGQMPGHIQSRYGGPTNIRPSSSARPKSSRGGRRGGRTGFHETMLWGGVHRISTNTKEESSSEESEDNEGFPQLTSAKFKVRFGDGLPFKVDITNQTSLHIIKGSIETQKTDVIVNTTPQFPGLVGAVSNALNRVTGGAVSTDCKPLGKLEYGEVKRTSGQHGSLNCKHIYHVLTMMAWDPKRGYDHVYDIVKGCLAEANNYKCASITFPAIGTGASKFPADKVADAMVKAICDFTSVNQRTSVKDVFIVVYYGDSGTCQIFEQEIPNILASPSIAKDDNDGVNQLQKKAKRIKTKQQEPRQKEQTFNINPAKKPKAKYKKPANAGDHSIADDVVFIKVTSKTSSDTIQKEFENLVMEEFISKTLLYDNLTELSQKEETTLKNLEKKFIIKVEIDKPKTIVKLIGLRKVVQKAEFEARRLLIEEFPSWRLRYQMVKRILESIQWCYDDNGTAKHVAPESNFDIHIGYVKGVDFEYHNNAENIQYKVIVNDLEEHPVSHPQNKRRLFQRVKVGQDIRIPEEWSIAASNNDTARFVLQSHDPEFINVKTKLHSGGCPYTQILNIIRIEDRYKWLQFEAKKKQLEKQNPKHVQNERSLWHGTDAATVENIIRGGYDRSFCGKNATAYGDGAYFATKSSYSNGFAAVDEHGTCRMFLNRVLTGNYCQGFRGMGYLPEKKAGSNILFDSAVNTLRNPSMFIIFHDTQAYPEYLIEYK